MMHSPPYAVRVREHGSSRVLDYHDRRNSHQPTRLDDRIEDIANLTLATLNDHERYLRSYKRAIKDMGKSAGSDGFPADAYSVPELAAALREIKKTIRDGTFVPNKHRKVKLPKTNRTFRTLTIPVFTERVVARSLNNALLDVLDSRFPDAFHAYRRNRGILTLLARIAQEYDPSRPFYIATADIENAFPTTPRNAVEHALSEFVPDEPLRNLLIQMSYPGNSPLGLPQGLATSPTLFTMVLSHHLTWPTSTNDDNTLSLTYSDNFVYASDNKERIMEAHRQHSQALEDLEMRFKADQPFNPVNLAEGTIDTLGTTIFTRNGRILFRPNADGWNNLSQDIRNSYLHPYVNDRVKEVMSGWIGRNPHMVHSLGATTVIDRMRRYCSQANIDNVHWDAIGNAANGAIAVWDGLVEGFDIQIPPEPTIWQYT